MIHKCKDTFVEPALTNLSIENVVRNSGEVLTRLLVFVNPVLI